MADPTNPGNPANPAGAGGPSSAGSGGQQPPFDAGTQGVLSSMEEFLRQQDTKNVKIIEQLKEMVEEQKKLTDGWHKQVKASEDFEAISKKIIEMGRKRGQQTKAEFTDAKKAHRDLQEFAKVYEQALVAAEANSKEAKTLKNRLSEVKKVMSEIAGETKLAEGQIAKVSNIFEEAAKNAQALAAAVGNLSRRSAAMKGLAGIAGAMGIGRGMSASMNRHLEQVEDVKQKIKESRELRTKATRKHMMQKRDNAVAEAAEKGINLGEGPQGDKGRQWLAEKVFGSKNSGTKKFKDFIAGEAKGGKAGGMAAEGAEGANWVAAMGEPSGAIEGAMAGLESGLEGLMAVAPEIIIPLTILAEAIKLLIGVFDTYVKQNQDVEKNLGKAGIFNQQGVGGGEAFARARAALNPAIGGQGLPLGMTFERNVELAGAFANAGYSPRVGDKDLQDRANAAPGAQGEFMKGSMGEAQRIVMGVSRIGGLTDAEGTENLIKLLNTYHETMASSEMFMTRINKDTQAAGISTTKYLKIIDEVNSAFDKMGKSLEQVTGIMRQLTRYGGISSETLKDLMEGLLNAGPKSGMGDAALSGYAQTLLQGSPLLEAQRGVEKKTLNNYMDNFNVAAKRAKKDGIDKDAINKLIENQDWTGAESKANEMGGVILSMPEGDEKKIMEGALQQVLGQIPHIATAMRTDAMGRTFGQTATGATGAAKITANLALLKDAMAKGNTSAADLFAGGGSTQAVGIFDALNEQFKQAGLGPIKETAETMGRGMVQDVRIMTNRTDQMKQGKILFGEFYKGAQSKEGIANYLTDKGLGRFMKDNGKDQLENVMSTADGMQAFLKLADSQVDEIGMSNDSLAKLISSAGEGNQTSDATLANNLKTAREVGMRTMKVEDILKTVFAPLLTSLLEAVEWIATSISKIPIIGGHFNADPGRIQKDMKGITDAIDGLAEQNKKIAVDRAPLEAKMEKGEKLSPREQKRYDELTAKMKENSDSGDQLAAIQQQGTFLSNAQMLQVEQARADIKAGKHVKIGTPEDLQGNSESLLEKLPLGEVTGTFKAFKKGYSLLQAIPGMDKAESAISAGWDKSMQGIQNIYNNYYSSTHNLDNATPSNPASSPQEGAQAPTGQPAKEPL